MQHLLVISEKRMAEVEADMAQQLANLREMEKRGELAVIPRGETALHLVKIAVLTRAPAPLPTAPAAPADHRLCRC